MSDYQVLVTYLTALFGRLRHDERGSATAQEIVIIGAAILGAVAIAAILWAKLRGGAESVDVPAPAGP